MKKWLIFIKERFEPVSHAVLITALFSANLLLAGGIAGRHTTGFRFDTGYLAAFTVIALMFFHLRLFDEIKDYDTDIAVNPTRPLPRGLIGLKEFKTVTFSVIWVELMISSIFLGLPAFISALVMVGYSLLMYREFFIGKWLGPQMELYAVSHTVVSAFMALFVCSVVSGLSIWEMKRPYIFLALTNWMIFNIFEFARKTFGKDEERKGVESYSKRLTPLGAVIAVMINAGLALFFLWKLAPSVSNGKIILVAEAALTGLLALAGLVYAAGNRKKVAGLYRGMATLYLVMFNVQIAYFVFIQK